MRSFRGRSRILTPSGLEQTGLSVGLSRDPTPACMRPVPHEFGRRPCACSQERARVERWVAEPALLAYTVIAQAKGAIVPEYMDVHRNMKGITPEDLLKAHQADL